MKIEAMRGNITARSNHIEPDSFINMRELDSIELKVNHLSLYIKTCIYEEMPAVDIKSVDMAINNINIGIFINGICEENNSVKTLLSKNIVYELARFEIELPFSVVYSFLTVSKANIKTK